MRNLQRHYSIKKKADRKKSRSKLQYLLGTDFEEIPKRTLNREWQVQMEERKVELQKKQ